MNKGKIALIVTSVILALGLIIAAVFIGLNWSKLKSAIVDKTQLYTYEQLEQAKKEGYDEAGLNKAAYEKQLKEFAGEVARLESEVNSLTNDKTAKIEEINELNLKISALSTKINFINDLLGGKDVSGYDLTEELKSFQFKLNELLQEKYNQGYNAGYDEGLANGTVNVPEGSFALIFVPNVPSTSSSVIEGQMLSSIKECSSDSIIPACSLTLKGYTFQGWSTKADGTGITYSDGATVLANSVKSGAALTLYAQWQAITYNVYFGPGLPKDQEHLSEKYTIEYLNGRPIISMTCEYDKEYSYDCHYSITEHSSTFNGAWTFMGLCVNNKNSSFFDNWNGSVDYLPGQTFKNLTSIQGTNVEVYVVLARIQNGQITNNTVY